MGHETEVTTINRGLYSSSGTHAARPSATGLPEGSLYYETDTGDICQVQSGAWVVIFDYSAITSAAVGSGVGKYGDGSDGDVVIAVDTNLARDMYYDNLTVNAGVTLNPNGYRIFVKNTLLVSATGLIKRQPTAAVDFTGATGFSAARLGTSANGGNGGGQAGQYRGGGGGAGGGVIVISAKILNNLGTITSAGGNGGNGTGAAAGAQQKNPGNAGAVSAPTAARGGFRAFPEAILAYAPDDTALNGGAGGGGGGATADNNNGVAGGASTTSLGGAGGIGGTCGAAGAGGGGAGGGGVVVLMYRTLTALGTVTAPAGTPGTGVGTGANGGAGAVGTVVTLAD